MWGWTRGPPHTYFCEGLADSEMGAFRDWGGVIQCPLGLWPFHCIHQDPTCLQTSGGDRSEGPYDRASPSPTVSAQVPTPPASCLGLGDPRKLVRDLRAWRSPGLAGFSEGHTPGACFPHFP